MTTPKAKFAGLALIAALSAVGILGLTAPAWAGLIEGTAAYIRGDYATAIREWRPLAKQGNANAQFFLGFMYENGLSVPQDYAKAMKWYRKAAEQGVAKAQHYVGRMYDIGQGVHQDYAKAMKWYRKAAEQGVAEAQHSLGEQYEKGQGVLQDYVQAHMWFNLAASNYRSMFADLAINDRDSVAKRMTPAQISEAQKLAREWKPKKSWWQNWR